MASYLEVCNERMRQRLVYIEGLASEAQIEVSHTVLAGRKHNLMTVALAKIADAVKDALVLRNHWYQVFVEEGIIKGETSK